MNVTTPNDEYIVTYSGVLFTMELHCIPKVNTQLLITNNSAPNTTNPFRLSNTTNSLPRSLCTQQRHNHRNASATTVALATMLPVNRPSVSTVALPRKRNNAAPSHRHATGRRRHATKETQHVTIYIYTIHFPSKKTKVKLSRYRHARGERMYTSN